MRNLVIDRSIWLRGEGEDESRLLRVADGKMCCVGIYLAACGVPSSQLEEVKCASEVRRKWGTVLVRIPTFPEEAQWLRNEGEWWPVATFQASIEGGERDKT